MHRSCFFPSRFSAFAAGLAVAALFSLPLAAQDAPQQPAAPQSAAAPQPQAAQASATLSNEKPSRKKQKTRKEDRVIQSKDTRRENAKEKKLNPLAGKDASLPDKALYDKALDQTKKGHFDVARLDLQTLLNTYPDSQYQMRAKLAIADSWYREGGSAALTQAEQEYNDFITFFPNTPEAAEAQMRVGDIYFKQMDVPDRDYQKALKAQDAYRLMLKQYPDSTLIPEARQKLREVQELLAMREADIAAFYGTHENWPASIARYQTVADAYPQYSHMDDVLLAIGDAYAAEARMVRSRRDIPEGPKATVLADYDKRAADAYRKVVLEHSAAPHVEDAKERLVSMNLPVPEPTATQRAASEELEGSRAQYNLQNRLRVLLMRKPDTVLTARTGEPPLEDAPITTAPAVTKDLVNTFKTAMAGGAAAAPEAAAPAPAGKPETAAAPTAPAAAPAPASAPLSFHDVAAPGEGGANTTTSTMTESAPAATGTHGNSLGVEVLTPGATTGSVHATPALGTTPPSDLPAATGAPDPNNGLKAVGPANTAALPPVEKPEAAPDAVNEAAGKPSAPAQTKNPNSKKNPKPAFDKGDESSSKHKPKKGLDKINPF